MAGAPASSVRTPAVKVTLDGKDLTSRIAPSLFSLTITEKRGGDADQLDLVLTDQDGRLDIPRKGVLITVALGWQGSPLVGKGSFKVDETEHTGAPDLLTIRARAADFTGALRIRQEKSWRNTTLGAIVTEIANRNGLTPQIAPELAGKAVAILSQSRESDSALLARLGRAYDAVSAVKNGRLVFSPIGRGSTPSGRALPTFLITRQDGDSHSWRSGEREVHTGVSAAWHSTDSATRHTVRAGATGNVRRLRTTYASEAEAKRAAEAEMGRIKRGAAEMGFTLAVGRPDLYPERKGKVRGFKPQIDATTWLIDQAVHTYGDGALTTTLQMQVAG